MEERCGLPIFAHQEIRSCGRSPKYRDDCSVVGVISSRKLGHLDKADIQG